MSNQEDSHHRRSIRLAEYDYTQEGAYFVTICAHQRACLFGDVVGEDMLLSTLGCIVLEEWERTALTRPYVMLDEFVVMPNYVHGIIIINHGHDAARVAWRVGAQRAAPYDHPAA